MMDIDDQNLQELKAQASGAAAQPGVSDDIVQQYEDARDLLYELGDGNLRDWVSRQYREWYQAWLTGEKPAPCQCSNPGCPLKNGSLPYEIRRQDSEFTMGTLPPVRDRIKNFLDDHSEAVVLHDAVEELEEKQHRAESMLEEVYRAGARPEAAEPQ